MTNCLFEPHTARPEARREWALDGAAWRAYQHEIRSSGVAPTFAAAKAAWRESYDKWLAWKAAPPSLLP
jgi:hypothetical protein